MTSSIGSTGSAPLALYQVMTELPSSSLSSIPPGGKSFEAPPGGKPFETSAEADIPLAAFSNHEISFSRHSISSSSFSSISSSISSSSSSSDLSRSSTPIALDLSRFSTISVVNITLQMPNVSSPPMLSVSSSPTPVTGEVNPVTREFVKWIKSRPDVAKALADPKIYASVCRGLILREGDMVKNLAKVIKANDAVQKNTAKENEGENGKKLEDRTEKEALRKVEESARRDIGKYALKYFEQNRRDLQMVDRILKKDKITTIAEITIAQDYVKEFVTEWHMDLMRRDDFPKFIGTKILMKLPDPLVRDHQFLEQQEERHQKLLNVTEADIKAELEERKRKSRAGKVTTAQVDSSKSTTENNGKENKKTNTKKLGVLSRIKRSYQNFKQKRYQAKAMNQYCADVRVQNQELVESERISFNTDFIETRLGRACVQVIEATITGDSQVRNVIPANPAEAEAERLRNTSLDVRMTPIYAKQVASHRFSMFRKTIIPSTALARVEIYWEDQAFENEELEDAVESELTMRGETLNIVCTLPAEHYEIPGALERHKKGIEKNFEGYCETNISFKKKKS